MLFAAVVFLAATCLSAAQHGGAPCTHSIQCGVPASNYRELRELAASTTGFCTTEGVCECLGGWGCSTCDIQLDLFGSTVRATTLVFGIVDMCSVEVGGGPCADDTQCGRGICIAGRCKCDSGWGCTYCTMDLEADVEGGATCNQFVTGSGACTSDVQCNQGSCLDGKCVCDTGFSCAYCDEAQPALVVNQATCDCGNVACVGGACLNGVCQCNVGQAGVACDFDVCKDVECGDNGSCNPTTGQCECDAGFEGEDCSRGGGVCASDLDCRRGGTGGTCNNATNSCVCDDGFTCPHCRTKGELCLQGAGGGECTDSTDCGNHLAGTGGVCLKNTGAIIGYCACFGGYTCNNCEKLGTSCLTASGGGECTDSLDCGFFEDETGGECIEGRCSCREGYTCDRCTATGTACHTSGGSGPCTKDEDCGFFGDAEDTGGICLAGHCACRDGYTCAHCGAVGSDCTTAAGGGTCEQDADCGTGECVGIGLDGFGLCQCTAEYACSHCELHVAWIGAGSTCEPPLESGAAYANLTLDRSLLPDDSIDLTQVYKGLAIAAIVIGAGVCVLGTMDTCRWKSKNKELAKLSLQVKRRRRNRRGRKRLEQDPFPGWRTPASVMPAVETPARLHDAPSTQVGQEETQSPGVRRSPALATTLRGHGGDDSEPDTGY